MNPFNYFTETDEVYHAKSRKYTNSHMLMEFMRSPYQYNRIRQGLAYPAKENDNFSFGTAFHMAVLQPDLFSESYVNADELGPYNQKTGKLFGKDTKEFGKWVGSIFPRKHLYGDDFSLIERMKDGIERNDDVKGMLSTEFYSEHIIRRELFGVECQCKLDFLAKDASVILDVKTSKDVRKFRYQVDECNYNYQMAFYYLIVSSEYLLVPGVFLAAFDKSEPWDCKMFGVSPETLTTFINGGIYKNKKVVGIKALIEQLKDCRDRGVWPTGLEGIEWI